MIAISVIASPLAGAAHVGFSERPLPLVFGSLLDLQRATGIGA
jgi:hypothetical protein